VVWALAVDAVRKEFASRDGYEVHSNNNAQTITIIYRPTNQAMQLTNTTGGKE
jgi:hypothetical protein